MRTPPAPPHQLSDDAAAGRKGINVSKAPDTSCRTRAGGTRGPGADSEVGTAPGWGSVCDAGITAGAGP